MTRKAANKFEDRLEVIKQAINKDMDKTGRVPTTVRSFSELHDYVDANWYVLKAFNWNFPFSQKGYQKANQLMDAADEWLKNGRQ